MTDDTDGLVTLGVHGVIHRQIDKAAVATTAAIAAETDGNRSTAGARGGCACGDIEAAVAATAADGLGENAAGLVTIGFDVTASESKDGPGVTTHAGIAAEADRNRARASARTG